MYKLDEKRANPGRHNRTYCTIKGTKEYGIIFVFGYNIKVVHLITIDINFDFSSETIFLLLLYQTGISIKTFTGIWTVVGGNATIMCNVALNSSSMLNCFFSNAFLQTFVHDGKTIRTDEHLPNEGTYNTNASITWTNGQLWEKGEVIFLLLY